MRIFHISDTHGFHKQLNMPKEEIDVMVFTGDESNHRSPHLNEKEFYNFINWYAEIPISTKIFIAGNHSSYVFHNEKQVRKECKDRGISYLNKDEITIGGVTFYGDPIVPRFGDWLFMTGRDKINKHWELIPDDVNVLLTHTPPKNVLDLSRDMDGRLEMCGCSALNKKIKKLKHLKVSCFGHIHNNKDIINTGIREINGVKFSNGASVLDGGFDKGVIFHGNIIEI